MNAPSDDVERLRKVAALLGSEHDGEVLSAARRIVDILKRLGLPPEAIVGLSAAPHSQPPPQPKKQEAPRPAAASQQNASDRVSSLEERIGPQAPIITPYDFAGKILATRARLPERGVEFLNDLVRKKERKMSERQENFLRSLARQALSQARRSDPRSWQ